MRIFKPVLAMALFSLVACAPTKLPDLGDAFKTKYTNLSADFWSKVNGRYANPKGNYLEFDREQKTMTRVIRDKTISAYIQVDVPKCRANESDCYCEDKGKS